MQTQGVQKGGEALGRDSSAWSKGLFILFTHVCGGGQGKYAKAGNGNMFVWNVRLTKEDKKRKGGEREGHTALRLASSRGEMRIAASNEWQSTTRLPP